MHILDTPFIASEQLWSSPVRRLLTAADTSSFYLDIILSLAILRFDSGYYSYIDVNLLWVSASFAAVALLIRFTEEKYEDKYRHWRLPLLRLARYHKILLLYCHAWQIRKLPNYVTDAQLETAFLHHRFTPSPTADAVRVLLQATGGAGATAFISRHLPFPEQLIIHALMAISNNALMAKIAIRVISLPAFHPSIVNICDGISTGYKWATIFVHPGVEQDPFTSTIGACSGVNRERGLVRLVLFTQFMAVFVLPVYLCYQHEARLSAELRRHQLRSEYGDEAAAALVPAAGPWWNRALVDWLVMGCFAVVVWTLLLVFDREAMAGIELLDQGLDAAEAWVLKQWG